VEVAPEGRSGYAATKAVSEVLLHRAALHKALDVVIIRPSVVSSHSENGRANQYDLTLLIILACLIINVVPSDPLYLHWVPVDLVARAICTLGFDMTQSGVFHVCDVPLRYSRSYYFLLLLSSSVPKSGSIVLTDCLQMTKGAR